MAVSHEERKTEFECAVAVCQHEDAVYEKLALVIHELPYTAARLFESRRPKYGAAHEHGPSYTLMGKLELLRVGMLDELTEVELMQERAGRLLTPGAQRRCLAKQLVLTSLTHNSFFPVVIMGAVVGDYPAKQTLEIYDQVARPRSETKRAPSCSVAKREILDRIVDRFGNRVEKRREGPAFRLKSHRPVPGEGESFMQEVKQLLPSPSPVPEPSNAFIIRHFQMLEGSSTEMHNFHRIFDVEKFDELAASIESGPAGPFREHMLIPDIALPCPTGSDSDREGEDTPAPIFDPHRLNERIEYLGKRRNRWTRRRKSSASSLAIQVDGTVRATIDAQNASCDLFLEAGASIVKLVDSDEDGRITVAKYILTYDLTEKVEVWDVDIPGMGQLRMRFEYQNDETIRTHIALTPGSQHIPDSLDALEGEFNEGRNTDTASQDALTYLPTRLDVRPTEIFLSTGSGKTRAWLVLEYLNRRAKDIFIRVESFSALLRSFSIVRNHKPREQAAENGSARGLIEASQMTNTLPAAAHMNKSLGEVDELVVRQAVVFDEFLKQMQSRGLSLDSIPSIHEPHQRLSRSLGIVALVCGLFNGIAVWRLQDLLDTLGMSATTFSVATLGFAALLAGKMWWSFGWSNRLYRKYQQMEHRLVLSLAGEAGREDIRFTEERIVDWRDLPLAKTLGWLLCSQTPDAVNSRLGLLFLKKWTQTVPWVGNRSSEHELVRMIGEIGAGERSVLIARAIVKARPFASTVELSTAIAGSLALPGSVTKVLQDSMSEKHPMSEGHSI